MIWMIPANGNMYDHARSFATNGFIDWRQNANYSAGDIVYIYCTKPYQRVMYKCEVLKCEMPFGECVDDEVFWANKDEYEGSKSGKYARLKLLEQVDTPKLHLSALMEHGLNGPPMGPVRVNEQLNAYISTHFNDYYNDGRFADVNEQQTYHEGHIKTVKVDKYERSSVARGKCLQHHGTRCLVCGMDFKERYGSIGEGFIHVHHLKPLYTIGRDYVVDYIHDLIPVCPNCHAMIHRIDGSENMSLDEIRKILSPGK